jgi:hypothetical protein
MQHLVLARDPGVEFVLHATLSAAFRTLPEDKARIERQLGQWRAAAEGKTTSILGLRTYATALETLMLTMTARNANVMVANSAGTWQTTLPTALGHGKLRYASLAADYTAVMYELAMQFVDGARNDEGSTIIFPQCLGNTPFLYLMLMIVSVPRSTSLAARLLNLSRILFPSPHPFYP